MSREQFAEVFPVMFKDWLTVEWQEHQKEKRRSGKGFSSIVEFVRRLLGF